jgi:hypothetical protein
MRAIKFTFFGKAFVGIVTNVFLFEEDPAVSLERCSKRTV